MESQPQVPEVALETHKEVAEQKREAFQSAVTRFDELAGSAEAADRFTVNGREYPVESNADAIVANAQTLQRVSQELLSHARESSDYRSEQAAAKLAALSEKNAELAALVAEIHAYYPDAVAVLEKHIPGVSAYKDTASIAEE